MQSLQNLIVFVLLVPGCAAFAAWKLIPARARRSLAASMLRLPHLPGPVESTLRRNAQAASGCGCDGCDHADKPRAHRLHANEAQTAQSAPTSAPITFYPRSHR